jgi:hypothetical protein
MSIIRDGEKALMPTPTEDVCDASERVGRILLSCSLKTGTSLNLEAGQATMLQLGDVLKKLILASISSTDTTASPFTSKIAHLLKRPLSTLFDTKKSVSKADWVELVEEAIAKTAALYMVAFQRACSYLFIIRILNSKKMIVHRVELDGSTRKSSLDSILKLAAPNIILLHQNNESPIRVTSTLKTS